MKQFLIKFVSISLSDRLTWKFVWIWIGCLFFHFVLTVPGYLKGYIPGFFGGLVMWTFILFSVTLGTIACIKVSVYTLVNLVVRSDSACTSLKRKLRQYVFIPLFNGVGIATSVILVAIMLPHMYASWVLEPIWRRWVETYDTSLWHQRDAELERIGFDHQSALRFWENNAPGIYLPKVYTDWLGISRKVVVTE